MKAKTINPIGVRKASKPNDVQFAASLAVLAKVQAEAVEVEPGAVVAPALEALIAEHARIKALDNAAWVVVGDLTEALEMSEAGHPMPKVQTSYLLTGRDDEGNDIKKPIYSYSEDAIEKVYADHLKALLPLHPESRRPVVKGNFERRLAEKLEEFRKRKVEYDTRERDIGLTAALAEARRLSDEVRGVEAEIVAFIPTTLAEAVEKAAWCAQAYRSEDDAYLYDHADGDENNPLLAALEAIGRALA